MLTIEEILPKEVFQQKDAYIFDHGKKDKEGVLKYQDSRSMYSWRQSQRGADKVAVRTADSFAIQLRLPLMGNLRFLAVALSSRSKGQMLMGKLWRRFLIRLNS